MSIIREKESFINYPVSVSSSFNGENLTQVTSTNGSSNQTGELAAMLAIQNSLMTAMGRPNGKRLHPPYYTTAMTDDGGGVIPPPPPDPDIRPTDYDGSIIPPPPDPDIRPPDGYNCDWDPFQYDPWGQSQLWQQLFCLLQVMSQCPLLLCLLPYLLPQPTIPGQPIPPGKPW